MIDAATQDKITQAINESLPSQVGAALQARLKEADAIEKKLDAATQEASRKDGLISGYLSTISTLQQNVARRDIDLMAFQAREKDFADSERRVMLADHRAASAELVAGSVKEVVAMVFRNAEVRRTVTSSTGRNITQEWVNGSSQNVDRGATETRTETETRE